MKSFPGTINESKNMYGSGKANSYLKTFDIERIVHGALNLNTSIPVIEQQLNVNNINLGNFQAYPEMVTLTNPSEISTGMFDKNKDASILDDYNQKAKPDGYIFTEDQLEASNAANNWEDEMNYREQNGLYDTHQEKIYFENPLELPAEIIALAKDYDWAYRYMVKEFVDTGEKEGDSIKTILANTSIAPSMFNPMYGVSVLGIIRNTPLLNDADDVNINPKITDCSIRTLCALSKEPNSELGMARYKYADFMYCKDLGKVSNNHLITLRKFPHPVVDHIQEMATPKRITNEHSFETVGDVGRLVTWFGTDDNKLEDIIKFSYHATWKHLEAKIEEKDSVADDSSSGIVGMIANAFNPVYNRGVNQGTCGNHSLWGWLGSKLSPKVFQGIGKNNELLRNYDNNKVYTPYDTIQESHIYEGKLEFTHNFTLNFSYKLRAYENINPRSAFLDLLGNILEVTYRRGKFWKGDRKLIGPPVNQAPFRMVNDFIDGNFEKVGSLFSSLASGGFNMQNLLGSLSAGFQSVYQGALNAIKGAAGGSAGEFASKLAGYFKSFMSGTGAADAFKGMMKNALGRPQAIAWQSLLDGRPAGIWHVTVGNPRNPILSIGNLIMENATITQSGPLGIDDFPTELRVTVELKHSTPRDITDIGRMYTKGAGAIYHVLAGHKVEDFWDSKAAQKIDTAGEETEKLKNENPPTSTTAQAEVAATGKGEESKASTNSTFEKGELTTAQKGKSYYNAIPLENKLPNPFADSDMHVLIMRSNNWAESMLRYSLDESA